MAVGLNIAHVFRHKTGAIERVFQDAFLRLLVRGR